MAVQPVRSSLRVDGTWVHLFQVVRDRRDGGEEWVVVGLSDDRIDLATVGFDWHQSVPVAAFEDRSFEPRREGGVPVWGY